MSRDGPRERVPPNADFTPALLDAARSRGQGGGHRWFAETSVKAFRRWMYLRSCVDQFDPVIDVLLSD
jgi:hypothetical protein